MRVLSSASSLRKSSFRFSSPRVASSNFREFPESKSLIIFSCDSRSFSSSSVLFFICCPTIAIVARSVSFCETSSLTVFRALLFIPEISFSFSDIMDASLVFNSLRDVCKESMLHSSSRGVRIWRSRQSRSISTPKRESCPPELLQGDNEVL